MNQEPRPVPVSLPDRREAVVEKLTRLFATDHIEAQELEDRVDRVYRARTLAELEAVHADLPDLAPGTGAVRTVGAGEQVRPHQTVVALMGGTERKGSWRPAKQITAVAMMGGILLDFREAQFAPGVTELNVFAMMGGVEVIVPPGLRVESEGFGLMGGFVGLDSQAELPRDAPTLRVQGLALMGGVEITERMPGESERDWKRRLRERRREMKRLRRG